MVLAFDVYKGAVDPPVQAMLGGGEFWRKEDPILTEDNKIVQGGFFHHQREVWDLPTFVSVLVGGFGCGKTLHGAKWAIANCLENAPAPIAAVSPTYAMARETTIQTLLELLHGKQTVLGKKFWWSYNKQEHVFTIKYKGRTGRIIVYSGDNPLALRGPNLAGAWIDEPFIQEEEVFTQMIARTRAPAARNLKILLTGTPEQLNWGYDLCMGDWKDRLEVGVVFASTRSNKVVGERYVKQLEKTYSEKAAKAFIEGRFVNLAEGLVYYGFDPMENVVECPMPPGAMLGAGLDFNVNPMSTTVFWHKGDRIHIFDEHELRNADTEYACSLLRDMYWDKELRNIYPDASGKNRATAAPGGKSDFHYIEDAGFTLCAPRTNPKRRDRYNAVNGMFKARDGHVSLTISPKCTKLIKYLQLYSHEQMSKQEAYSHLLDAFSYPVSHLYGSHRPRASETILIGH